MTEDWLAIVDWHRRFQRDHVLHQPLTGHIVLELLEEDPAKMPVTFPCEKTLLDACVDQVLGWVETDYLREHLMTLGVPRAH
jgi:hypothetical protein